MEYMLMPFARFFDFSGRSRRKEYWMFVLLNTIVQIVLAGIMFAGGASFDVYGQASYGPMFWLGGGLLALYWLAVLIPSVAVTVRRFHDQDKSGWLTLLVFVPYLGGLIVFVFMLLEGTRGPNRYGPDPKEGLPRGV
ncbi:DUF805 domain-containing protein [Croceicoccus mobilis]|uniref:Membrane protein n=1 Tax=Croceicoccus mobilis TaxID=1703339 RepID=A0A916Z2I2_9SPHN|nr:DUF805 domain-containing protein [Croceicoccus mobilis]GGD73608.1 membrane protein [Croceicoccus mobilis]